MGDVNVSLCPTDDFDVVETTTPAPVYVRRRWNRRGGSSDSSDRRRLLGSSSSKPWSQTVNEDETEVTLTWLESRRCVYHNPFFFLHVIMS